MGTVAFNAVAMAADETAAPNSTRDLKKYHGLNISIFYNGDYFGAEWHRNDVAGPDCLICHNQNCLFCHHMLSVQKRGQTWHDNVDDDGTILFG